jgi:hypothetical protein
MNKKIRGINEFEDDSRFNFDLDDRKITEEENKEICDYINRMTENNLKNFPKRTTPNFTIEEYREIMLDLQRIDNFKYTQEEKDELDKDCMEIYGEPFFKKEDNK